MPKTRRAFPTGKTCWASWQDQGEAILGQVEETTKRVNSCWATENQKSFAVGAGINIGKAATGATKLASHARQARSTSRSTRRWPLIAHHT